MLWKIPTPRLHTGKKVFSVPYGNAGKSFVSELSRARARARARASLEFAHGSALETVALKAVSVVSILILQKPFRASKPRPFHLPRKMCFLGLLEIK